ncbi:MAG: copper chaperone Copz family protein [Elusimicrobia bacterium]|nr:copper chaperone Copz family protein [Elusimicrobiota bacterium]
MADVLETHEACCKIPTYFCPCPVCGNTGRRVTAVTLDHHIPSHLREGFGDEATFCLNPACEVVYCNPAGKVIRKGETVLPVTIKDPGEEVNVCYCFGFTRGDIRRELREKGKTDIPTQIKQGVQEGRCDCARKNPQGACCLGNVGRTITAITSEREVNKRK